MGKEVATRKTGEVARPEEKRERFIRPRTAINEYEDCIKITMDLPGVSKDNLEINYNRGELTVTGRREPWEETNMKPVYVERFDGSYRHTFTLDDTLDAEKIEAHLNNGVLVLTLPKKEAVKPKRIEIKTG